MSVCTHEEEQLLKAYNGLTDMMGAEFASSHCIFQTLSEPNISKYVRYIAQSGIDWATLEKMQNIELKKKGLLSFDSMERKAFETAERTRKGTKTQQDKPRCTLSGGKRKVLDAKDVAINTLQKALQKETRLREDLQNELKTLQKNVDIEHQQLAKKHEQLAQEVTENKKMAMMERQSAEEAKEALTRLQLEQEKTQDLRKESLAVANAQQIQDRDSQIAQLLKDKKILQTSMAKLELSVQKKNKEMLLILSVVLLLALLLIFKTSKRLDG